MTNEELFKNNMIDELYIKNQKFIYYLVKKYKNLPSDDVISLANIGFTKSIESYSLDKNTKWLTYSSRCMENEILMYLRKDKKRDELNLEYAICGDEEGNELTLLDIVPDECNIENEFIERLDIENMRAAIDKLPDKYKSVVELHLTGVGQKEIARRMKLSQSYISRMLSKAVYKLRQLMKGSDYMEVKELNNERKVTQTPPENKSVPVENRPILQVIKFGGKVGEYFIKDDTVEITLKENQSVVEVPKSLLNAFAKEIVELDGRIKE